MASKGGSRVNPDGKKVNAELFVITYGCMIAQLIQEIKDEEKVNQRLDQMGYRIGTRLVEDYIARTNMERCTELRETADVLSRSGFSTYLGVQPQISNWSEDGKAFSLLLNDNPLTDFVDLPEQHSKLLFSNIVAGAVRGALDTVQIQCKVSFLSDRLQGAETTELRIQLVTFLDDEVPPGDD